MKMLTKAIKKKLPKLYTTDGVKTEDKMVVCKFFTPWSNFTWYVFEGQMQEDLAGDWEFFGAVDIGYGEPELGYFTLAQLTKIRSPAGLRVERDYHFENVRFGDIK